MDLPKLNDARRIARLALVFDEVYNAKDTHKPFVMSGFEFQMCGGKLHKDKNDYSLYRQLLSILHITTKTHSCLTL